MLTPKEQSPDSDAVPIGPGSSAELLLQAALEYAARAWPVFPLHSVEDGACSCGRPECPYSGKHPRTLHGLHDATTDPSVIARWWRQWPLANVAILTGSPSSLVVLDVDPRHAGDETLRDLEDLHEPLPTTVEAVTGGAGRHIFFQHPGRPLANSAGAIGPGLDIRADGGYVVAPPSVTSAPYAWELSSHPDDVPLAPMPPWLLDLLCGSRGRDYQHLADGPVTEGQRNATLTSLGGLLRGSGLDPSTIHVVLQSVNAERCAPRLPDTEVAHIAHSVARYSPRVQFPPMGPTVGTELYEVSGAELARGVEGREAPECLPFLGEDGLVVRGWSHLLAGYPRVGKTELTVRQVAAWISSGLPVVYFTEEPETLWRYRLSRLEGDWDALQVVFALGAEPAVLLDRAATGKEQVVVIDTLRGLLQLRDETDNSEIAHRISPWVAACRTQAKTLLLLHHDRKGGGDHGEGIAGGHALLGSVDIALEVLRDPSGVLNRRLLRSFARLVESRELLYERSPEGYFRSLGDPQALKLEEVKSRALRTLDSEWRTTKELHESLDEPRPSAEQFRQALLALAREGQVERDPPLSAGEARGKAHRWRAAAA